MRVGACVVGRTPDLECGPAVADEGGRDVPELRAFVGDCLLGGLPDVDGGPIVGDVNPPPAPRPNSPNPNSPPLGQP